MAKPLDRKWSGGALMEKTFWEQQRPRFLSPDDIASQPTKHFAHIPDALRSVPRWAVWKRLEDGRKIPISFSKAVTGHGQNGV